MSDETQLERQIHRWWDRLYPPADWSGAESAVGVMAQRLEQARKREENMREALEAWEARDE